jgi:hypothetical protein
MNINEKHKSSVFSELFGKPDVLRELYSAIEGVTIPPDTPININTLSNALIKGKLNDVSFTIDNRLVVLVEHQSTINNNMPLRMLMYIANVYQGTINQKLIHQRKTIEIPKPKFIVLYNGTDYYPEKGTVRLSDAFKSDNGLKLHEDDLVPLELTAKVYNINYGHNAQMLEKSETLNGYSIFVSKIREYREKLPLEEAVLTAIKYCIDNNILRHFFEENSSGVFKMLFEEYNHDDALFYSREEGIEIGREQGLELGREEIARKALAEGASFEFVQKITGLSTDTIKNLQGK